MSMNSMGSSPSESATSSAASQSGGVSIPLSSVTLVPSGSASMPVSTVSSSSMFTSPTSQADADAYANAGAPFIIPIDIPIGGGKQKRSLLSKAFPFLGSGLRRNRLAHNLVARAVVRTYIKPNGNTTTDASQASVFQILNSVLYSNGTPVSTDGYENWIPFAGSEPQKSIATAWEVTNGSLAWMNADFDNMHASFFRVPSDAVDNAMILVQFHGQPPVGAVGLPAPGADLGQWSDVFVHNNVDEVVANIEYSWPTAVYY